MLRHDRFRAGEDEFHRIDAERDHLVAEFLDLGDTLAVALTAAIDRALEGRRFDAWPRQETARDLVAQPHFYLRPRRTAGERRGIAVIEDSLGVVRGDEDMFFDRRHEAGHDPIDGAGKGQMRMWLDEAGHQRAAAAIDNIRAGRRDVLAAACHCRDPILFDQHLARNSGRARAVEDRDVGDPDRGHSSLLRQLTAAFEQISA